LFVLRAIVMGAAGSGSVLVSTAMITDAIEYDRLTTGQRREGVFLGGFELVQTTSFVIGPLVVGFVLSGAGLVPGQVSAAEQPPEAIAMIRNAMATIPAVTCVVGMFLLMFYRLTAQRLADLRADGAVAPESP
jgi:GPH family glycoside/pentoside/hexuronide:cation symporter